MAKIKAKTPATKPAEREPFDLRAWLAPLHEQRLEEDEAELRQQRQCAARRILAMKGHSATDIDAILVNDEAVGHILAASEREGIELGLRLGVTKPLPTPPPLRGRVAEVDAFIRKMGQADCKDIYRELGIEQRQLSKIITKLKARGLKSKPYHYPP